MKILFDKKRLFIHTCGTFKFQILNDLILGIAAGPVTEDNFFEWEAAITGPEGTYFEDGVFIATLSFPQDYPLNPPKMKFKSELFHPNIYADGRVCIR